MLQEEAISEAGSWDEATNVSTLADLPHFTVNSKLAEKSRQDALYDRYDSNGRLHLDRHSRRASHTDDAGGPGLHQ